LRRAHVLSKAYDAVDVSTSLLTYETSGCRFAWGTTVTPSARWTVDGGYHAEFGPGAASRGFVGALTFTPGEFLALSVYGSTLDRPLEFRFDESSLKAYGLSAECRAM